MKARPQTQDCETRDHGGGLDAARARFGGARADWLDLSTGINPVPYPLGDLPHGAWADLPDSGAMEALEAAARAFWNVPPAAGIVAAPGASALIAQMPYLAAPPGTVRIDTPTYNEHAAAFTQAGWRIAPEAARARARVVVHPNNPTGTFWPGEGPQPETLIIDESFCDIAPARSHIARTRQPGTVILKSFGKFWGLAGLRLGFAIGAAPMMAELRARLGPWAVSGPALAIGTRALSDPAWAEATRARLAADTARLDRLVLARGATLVGGTPLFRLYQVDSGARWQTRLARAHVWSRAFPYAPDWLRLGLPAPDRWPQLEAAL